MKRRSVFLLFCLLIIFAAASGAKASDEDVALDILDAWTSFRWGEDNLAWVVHYPDELVDPWVRSEAERQKMRPEQIEEYRKAFSDELRIGSATAVLVSVYGFGASPVNLSPLAKNIALVDSYGNRVAPIVVEKRLEDPISGLVQGFVYFPLQTDKNFKIAMRGLVPNRETNFTFNGAPASRGEIATTTPAPVPEAVYSKPQKQPEKEVVVKIPTKNPTPPKKPAPVVLEEENDFGDDKADGEVFAPTTPPVTPSEDVVPEAVQNPEPEPPVQAPKLAPKQVLEIYLRAWMDGDTEKMYSYLSAESQGKISRELFNKEIMSGNFRSALRSGYKVSWTGDSARITVAKKVLFVRTLETKQVNFVDENGTARVSW